MRRIKKWLIGIVGLFVVSIIGFIILLLTPRLFYSGVSHSDSFTIYHNQELSHEFVTTLAQSGKIIQYSALFDENFQIEICLKDGSSFPQLIKTILGDDVIRAYSNKSVVLAADCPEKMCLEWRGHSFNYTQFLSHVLIHNLQYNYHGFWDANPLGGYPEWKWEGYADYIAIGRDIPLYQTINAYQKNAETPFDFVDLGSNHGTLAIHVKYLVLTQYCLEIENQSYEDFMNDPRPESEIWGNMMKWYNQ